MQAIAVIYPISQTILKFQTPSPWFSDETQDIFLVACGTNDFVFKDAHLS